MFEWKPEYSVQIPKIDVQHQRLFALAAELHAAMAEGKGKTVLEQSLARLVDYTKVHFAAEEEFMGKYGYPEAAGHKAQHEALSANRVLCPRGAYLVRAFGPTAGIRDAVPVRSRARRRQSEIHLSAPTVV